MEPNEIKVEVGIPARGCNTDESGCCCGCRLRTEIYLQSGRKLCDFLYKNSEKRFLSIIRIQR